jgi:propionyl-CoA synthetase
MEEVLSSHPDVAECAVFGVNDELKGQIPVGLFVLKSGVTRDAGTVANEVVQMMRDTIGPVASFKAAVVVQRLPKTRSGKILRGTMQKIANGDLYATPATIDDPAVLAEIETAMAHVGYAKSKLRELRDKVRNLAFAIWEKSVNGRGSHFWDASSDWFTARKELGIPPDLFL